ncbi:MAG: DNA polymerase III subunit alpha [Hyphomicrobiales bacterium]
MSELATDPGFVHLRAHSAYSLLEGALPVGKLVDLARKDDMPALGLVDTGNLFGALEFSQKAAGAGIQAIVGCQLAVEFADQEPSRKPGGGAPVMPGLVLLAATEAGYSGLIQLVSRSFLDTDAALRPHVGIDLLREHSDGIIALTGGPGGPVDMALAAGLPDLARARLERLAAIFGDRLYVELQRHGTDTERQVEAPLVDLAYELDLPIVATNEPFFAERGDFEAHDALICIAEGRVIAEENRRHLTPEHGFKTRAEMVALFADVPEAIENTIEIARRCVYRPKTRAPILPRFIGTGEDAEREEARELRTQAAEGLARRLAAQPPSDGFTVADYEARLEFELDVIERMKFPGYFLIVADFIKWAKSQRIPVGPGRGSGAGSVVAWALTITDLDPLRFGLLFERFLNPERVSMPDFDIDFCQERRDEVIHYVQQRYGRDHVAQIITFGTLQARAVMRDVGRVLQMPYGQVDRLAKLVPNNPANPTPLGKAIEEEPRLQAERDEEPIVARLLDIAQRLEGLYRHASTHAAGIVIGDRPLASLVPLYRDPRSDMPVTQFNMKWVEQGGLVKFDFLGLKTLSVIQRAVDLIARNGGPTIDISAIPLDDEKTYAMLQRAETIGVFQFESGGMRDLMRRAHPTNIEDLIALVALFRPGPMENIPKYLACKHGEEQPEFLHETIEPVVRDTYGVIIYQEQVMQIAQVFAGYTLGEADLLRRAMGKKIKAEMDAQRSRFVEGAVARDVERARAEFVFDLVDKFAGYGFNKSHSACYALVAYHTAWLKANYPGEFIAASMTFDMGNTDKLAIFRREAMRLGIRVAPPSINASAVEFDVRDGTIFYSLAALKGVGRQAVEHIVEHRAEAPFRDLADFAARISPRTVNKRTLESLIAAGAFDDFEPDRARVFAGIDFILGHAARTASDAELGQGDMFGEGGGGSAETIDLPRVESWLPSERLHREQDSVGFYLSAHPLDGYGPILEKMRVQYWADFVRAVRAGAVAGRLAGTVTIRNERKTRTGGRIGIIQLSDPTGEYEAVMFSEALNQYRDMLEPGQSVVVLVAAEERDEEVRVRIQTVEPLDKVASRDVKSMRIFLRDPAPLDSIHRRLAAKGEGDVSLVLILEDGAKEVEVRLPGRYLISPQVAGAVKSVPGVVQVQMV